MAALALPEIDQESSTVDPIHEAKISSTYETCCGSCGSQFVFNKPLTGWAKVWCYGCQDWSSVR